MAALCGAEEGGHLSRGLKPTATQMYALTGINPVIWRDMLWSSENHRCQDVCPNGQKSSDMKRYALMGIKPQMSRGMLWRE